MNDLLYTIWLSLACTPGSETFPKLLLKFSTPLEVYNADGDDLVACVGTKCRDYTALCDKDTAKANEILDFCLSKKVGIITYFDDEYPKSLREIKNPPVLLYYRGHLPNFNEGIFISVVGTRRLTQYGRNNAFSVSYDLARAGATIVSGMATGIDGVSLAGALAAGMSTVAILGSGINVCYPPQHKRLAREITKLGCVMTEYPPNTRPERYNFPVRNRIISALSRATVAMEGNERSGTLITARCAAEQGKIVYAFPGNVGNAGSEATNLLIKNGAKLFTCADDIVRDFDSISPGLLNPFNLSKTQDVDMYSVLREFEVSCVCKDDCVFKVPRSKKASRNDDTAKGNLKIEESDAKSVPELPQSFDKSLVSLYKKIPMESECSIEQLVDSERSLREVMQGILKLEISRFVIMLPGDRVKRNI